MKSFTLEEFESESLLMVGHVARYWNTGDKRKSRLSSRDALLTHLSVIKYGQQWKFMAKLFDINGNVFDRFIINFLSAVSEQISGVPVQRREKNGMCSRASET